MQAVENVFLNHWDIILRDKSSGIEKLKMGHVQQAANLFNSSAQPHRKIEMMTCFSPSNNLFRRRQVQSWNLTISECFGKRLLRNRRGAG